MSYAAVTIEGGLFPADLMDRVATGEGPGQRPADFGVEGRLPDEIQSAFSDIRSYWESFNHRLERFPERRTSLTREMWVVPFLEILGFGGLQYQRAALPAGEDSFVISHLAGDDPEAPPVHIVALDQKLNERDGRRSPHATVQEYLNRSDAIWGIVTNGVQLRLLRDSTRISHPTFVEFNLRAMVEANLYSEFVLLYRLLHATRFPKSAADTSTCLLETYYTQGVEEGGRVREHLSQGVELAIETLANGLLTHPESRDLREALANGALTAPGFYRELLRLIYRLLFLMVAEERKLLFPEGDRGEARTVYARCYSIGTLRDRTERRFSPADARYGDLWQGLLQTFGIFRDDVLATKLGLHALNGELFGALACKTIETASCSNAALLTAIRALSSFREPGSRVLRRVNYAALDVEELGSVYEGLLEFQPSVDVAAPSFALVKGSDRKRTGSYYTPKELVNELISSALEPVLAERVAAARTKEAKEAAILAMRVIDPASGSGHFLLAAARRMARELAQVRTGEIEPAPEQYREALRDVIRICIYAVDRNPLAVDLCKVASGSKGTAPGCP